MKRLAFQASAFLLPLLCSHAAAQGAETHYRGWSVGSTHILGYDYEVVRENTSTQYSIGLFELVPSGTITWKKYRPRDGARDYYGGGPWVMVALTPDEGGMLLAARGVLGREWDLSRDGKWGIELSINVPLHVQSLWGPERHLNRLTVLPIPGVFYRKSF